MRSCSRRCRRVAGSASRRSKACRHARPRRCRRRGSSSTCRSAATASRARSCRRPRCSRRTPKPTDADIDRAMAGNICRCATYQRIRAAIHDAARAGWRRMSHDRRSHALDAAAARRRPRRASSSALARRRRGGSRVGCRHGVAAAAERRAGARSRRTPSCASARRHVTVIVASTSRWARAPTPASPRWSPRSSTPTGRRCAPSTRRPTRSSTTTSPVRRRAGHRRLDRDRELLRCSTATPARPRARCWSRRPPSSGTCRPSEITVAKGVLTHAVGKRATLRRARRGRGAAQPCPADAAAQGPGAFKLIGKPTLRAPRLAREVHRHARSTRIDVKLPGMLTAVVAQPPRFGAEARALRRDRGARRSRA